MIDLTENDLIPEAPAKTINVNKNIKQEPQITLLGSQLIIPDEPEEFEFSDSSDVNAESDVDAGSDNGEIDSLFKRISTANEPICEDEEHSIVKVNNTAIFFFYLSPI